MPIDPNKDYTAPIPEFRDNVDASRAEPPDPVPVDEELRVSGEIASALSLVDLLRFGRNTWGARALGPDSTATLPGVLVRLQVTVGDVARIARTWGSAHWEAIANGRPVRDEARLELMKELGNVVLSTIRWCDDLGLDVGQCVALAMKCQREYVEATRPR